MNRYFLYCVYVCITLGALNVAYERPHCFSLLLHNVYLYDVSCGVVTTATAIPSFHIGLSLETSRSSFKRRNKFRFDGAHSHLWIQCLSLFSLIYQLFCCLSHQSSGLAGDDLVKALEGLGLEEGGDGGGGDDGNVLPIMQSIMQNLLSKDVLYPSLKEITAKVCIG